MRNASEHFEVREDWLPSIDYASIHEIDDRGCRFGQIEVRHVLLTHHGACYLEYLCVVVFVTKIFLRFSHASLGVLAS